MDSMNDAESWRALHQRLRGISKRRASLDAEEAGCLREAIAIRLWRRLGYVHVNEYLERELGYAPQVGIERVRVAQALAELPRIEASLGAGRLPFSAVRELTRVATPDTELAWLEAADGKNLRQIEAMVSGRKPGDRPDTPARPELVNRIVRLELSPSAFAAFRQVQTVLADELGGRLDDSALIETLCRRALEAGASSERPAHQIAFTVCDACRRGWQDGAGREVAVSSEVIDRARCDAELIGSLDASEPARVTSTITPRIRRQVLARDHHRCTVPGCRSARNLDVHHVQFRSDGGGNELSNLLTVCSGHHAQLHAGQLTVRGKAPHALEFSWREASDGAAKATDGEAPRMPRVPHRAADPSEISEPIRRSARVRDARSVLPRRDEAPGPGPTECANRRREGDEPVKRSKPVREAGAAGRSDESSPMRRRAEEATDEDSAPARAPHQPVFGSPDLVHDETAAWAIDRDACAALTTAGFKPHDARVAVAQARPHVGATATLEQVLREALRYCAPPVRSEACASAT